MADRRTATPDPFAATFLNADPWTQAMTTAFRYWLSFWPVAPIFGVEWRFAEMGRAQDPMKASERTTPPEAPVAETLEAVAETGAAMAEATAAATEATKEATKAATKAAAKEAATPDDLTRIKGIGPAVARQLEAHGIRSFRQIAALSEDELAAIDEKLTSIKGGCFRDDWIGQAKALAG